MAKRLDTSSVSEDDVTALFENHDLYGENGEKPGSTETSDDDSEESTEEEEEESESEEAEAEDESEDEDEPEDEDEEEEEEESEESEEDDEEPEAAKTLDWSKASPKHKAAFEKSQAETQKWQKAHSKLQSQLTRESKTRQQEESTLTTLREKASAADQWDALLAKHPELQETLENAVAKIRDPNRDVPEYLQKDPMFQHVQRQNQILEQRLAQFEQSLQPVQDIQAEREQAKAEGRLDEILGDANSQFKDMFGKDMTKAEKAQVLQDMLEQKVLLNGGKGVDGRYFTWKIFGAQHKQVSEAQRGQRLKEKAKKFGSRNRSLNTVRPGGKKKDAETADEAIAMALAEQGFGT